MQGIPFAIEVFTAGLGVVDWFLFHGHYTAIVLRYIMG